MATVFHPQSELVEKEKSNILSKAKDIQWFVPIGRTLFGVLFILSGLNHFTSGSISYADNMGLPIADILVPISGIIAIIGGLSVTLGLHARVGAIAIIVFLLPVTFIMHPFWVYSDVTTAQMQMGHFFKNLSLLGAAILISSYGAGPHSFDNHRSQKRKDY